ncbi:MULTISPECIES: carbonic anhydrase [Alteromonas]|jgi:carbonic anhydrase|uniref:Carbonic anhydrase n=2 Tax=Alteromonas mediterranea TaxID=314275 RepID=A0AAC9ACP4_9ALTE|nr:MULTISPECIES: carbonic anhydrase [Alteromonas]MBR9783246.1 carbonic anhydrase [Gammaproteobacteria bacterium]MEA3381855.1 carbonic anhydrase [Pseudomonadota bacterium]AEA97355.1 carbonic anhydrase [Alteromonas mediterranea DE]AFV84609.1 carbonic anhydrase [Alteromonas mediterranea DE1]AGP81010.1 carbonic anhydrase [Alteromonas mediterranea MED64]|tara:strand:- start:1665 stop:2318 length:654 start_codon:yes stop_codon:yes gene_type:complete
MDHVISGVAKFQKEVYPNKKATFQKLANGQNPEVLFITCSDSRIDPNLVTQTDPGELFICRNAGNIVPPHSNQTGGMTASIEFAVAALGVSHIVVCGHTDCGAMKGAINPAGLDSLPHVKEWLGHCRVATDVVKERCGHDELSIDDLEAVTKENVVQQIQHLRTHPAVAAKIATGQVKLHGWVYNIGTGEVLYYNTESGEFDVMDESTAEAQLARSE